MNLINTFTLELEFVSNLEQTPYAILSHTWGYDEVSYQDFRNLAEAKRKQGFKKIMRTCELASLRDLKYVWVDTCCIDKSSSAELSEAINSMFQWYRRAAVCFAYVADLPVCSGATSLDWPTEREYRWFTRGWTLQELIAAEKVEFYDQNWVYRGEKSVLLRGISHVTKIDESVLSHSATLSEIPVARKMAWAATRKTTRIEDLAYCLLGLFDINMPMIYGEGSRAFTRLQEEIAKATNDMSLFAWTSQTSEDGSRSESDPVFRGLLAESPAEFFECRYLVRYKDLTPTTEFAITNNGVRFQSRLGLTNDTKEHVLGLDCGIKKSPEGTSKPFHWMGIYLLQTGSGFVRLTPSKLFLTENPRLWIGEQSTIYVHKKLGEVEERRIRLELASRIYIRFLLHPTEQYYIRDMFSAPESLWNPRGRYFLTLESVMTKAATPGTIYPLFTGIKGFNIRDELQGHVCSCVLICGIFEDSQGSYRPCAVVYTDKDPSTMDIFYAIEASKGQANGLFLNHIREFMISKHSSNGVDLSWSDLSHRNTDVSYPTPSGERRLSIRLTITPTDQEDWILSRESEPQTALGHRGITKDTSLRSPKGNNYVVSLAIGS